MKSRTFPPPPELQHIVACFWTLEAEAHQDLTYRFSPDAYLEILIQLKGKANFSFADLHGSYSSNGIFGQFNRYFQLRLDRDSFVFLIKFHPWAMPFLVENDIDDFSNAITQISGLEGFIRRIQDLYHAYNQIDRVIEAAESWLIKQIKVPGHFPLTVHLAQNIRRNFKNPIRTISAQYGLSERRLQQIFKSQVGISPKQFQRIIRFRKATDSLLEEPDFNRLILDCGYYDWSHFTKDMNYFLEMSPTEFMKNTSPEKGLYNLVVR